MNDDSTDFKNKLQKFSVVRQCPRCRQLSLSYKNNSICCSDCGYEEKIPAVRKDGSAF